MKILTIVLLISLNSSVGAQKSIFVRVYDLTGKKINKGDVFRVTDTSLQLEGKPTPVNIPVHNIGSIKTKRSGGDNVATGSLIGALLMAGVGAAAADSSGEDTFNAWAGAAVGAIIGIPIGAAIGGLTILFKNSKAYLINGDVTKWKAFQLIATEKNIK